MSAAAGAAGLGGARMQGHQGTGERCVTSAWQMRDTSNLMCSALKSKHKEIYAHTHTHTNAQMPNPVQLWTAMMAASQAKNMQKEMDKQKEAKKGQQQQK